MTATATLPRDRALFDDLPAEATLDDLVTEDWEALAAARPVACPVCGGELTPRHTPGTAELSGHCAQCGATLA